MKHCNPDSPTHDIDVRELNALRNLTAHQDIAAVAALDYCVEYEICTPPWVQKAVLQLVIDLLKREKSRKRGRAAGRVARLQQDQWDFERWDAVLEARRMRDKVKRELELHAEYGRKPHKSLGKLDAWFDHKTFVCASMLLSGRNARAGADAMKASYRKVKRSLEDPTATTEYHIFEGRFLKSLGLEDIHERKPGTKMMPLYDLTP
jgi:hypothetical protein